MLLHHWETSRKQNNLHSCCKFDECSSLNKAMINKTLGNDLRIQPRQVQKSSHACLSQNQIWKSGCPKRRGRLEGSICCSNILCIFVNLMLPSWKYRWLMERTLTQPHATAEPGFLAYCWPNNTVQLCDGPAVRWSSCAVVQLWTWLTSGFSFAL